VRASADILKMLQDLPPSLVERRPIQACEASGALPLPQRAWQGAADRSEASSSVVAVDPAAGERWV
jgi:hypothetical protein